MFVLSFKNSNDDPIRDYFYKYDMLLVKIKDLNALINNNPFLISQQKANKKRLKNVKKKWFYNRKTIRLFASSKLF